MRKKDNKLLDFFIGRKIAHRGLWDENNPENSIGAFKKCIDGNIPIELDVHILKDNTLVVIHDVDTGRMTGKKIVLKNAKYDDIKDLNLKNTDYKIPTFDEILNLVDGKVFLDIEVKSGFKNFRICRELCKYLDNYNGDFLVKSFNPIYLMWFRLFRSKYIRGLLVSRLSYDKFGDVIRYINFFVLVNFIVKPDFLCVNYKNLPNKKIDKLRERGIPILLYTVKEKDIVNYKYDGYVYEE